jgi:hypothetical protein
MMKASTNLIPVPSSPYQQTSQTTRAQLSCWSILLLEIVASQRFLFIECGLGAGKSVIILTAKEKSHTCAPSNEHPMPSQTEGHEQAHCGYRAGQRTVQQTHDAVPEAFCHVSGHCAVCCTNSGDCVATSWMRCVVSCALEWQAQEIMDKCKPLTDKLIELQQEAEPLTKAGDRCVEP